MAALLPKVDSEFAATMIGHFYAEIEQLYEKFPKHEKIRIQQWVRSTQCRKLCQVTTNPAWKRNRNTYAEILLEMVYNTNLEPPFNKIPPEGTLPVINRANVQATQFVFVHKKKDVEWNGRRSSTPKRHTVSFHDLPRGEVQRVSATPRGTKLEDPVERPRTAADVRPDPPRTKAAAISPPSTSISEIDGLRVRLEASQRSEQLLRAEVQVIRRKSCMRTIAEQKLTIDELRAEITRLKRHDEAVKPAARYLSYNDAFEREILEQPFQRHTKPVEKPPPRLLQTDLESLDDILGIPSLKVTHTPAKVPEEVDLSREEGSLNYSSEGA